MSSAIQPVEKAEPAVLQSTNHLKNENQQELENDGQGASSNRDMIKMATLLKESAVSNSRSRSRTTMPT
jgi:hypothetical protein